MRVDEPMRCEQVAELGPALALDAIEEPEREVLEAHLERCPACAREVDELRQVAARLGRPLPQLEPPPALWTRILAEAQRDLTMDARPLGRLRADSTSYDRGSRSSWLQRWSPAFSLASLLVALAALLWGASLQWQLGQAWGRVAETDAQLERIRGNYGTVVQVLASPQTQVRELQPGDAAPNAEGKVWIDRASGQGMLMARDLPPLPSGRTYQVWLVSGVRRASPGLLSPEDGDIYYLVLPPSSRLTDYQRVGVTPEPDGGSPGPTGPRVIGGDL